MDRNREARKSTMAASANGLSRRRHRNSSLRDSTGSILEEDGAIEWQETARLRDRGLKKDLDRDRPSRNKRRRGDRLNGGEESSEESANDEEEDYDDERGVVGGAVRLFSPSNQTASILSSMSNHHYVNRKSFPSSGTGKVLRPAESVWKAADEVIGFAVPRKARSASGKRSQECSISGSGVVSEQINGKISTSQVRLTPPSVSPPSSSDASVRKKMKPNGSKPRPPKSLSKASTNPEELEIEIAEVLYGMMTQTHSYAKKETTSSDLVSLDLREMNTKSRVSSPISNSTSQLRQNSSSPLSAVAPKRKMPRQVSDNLVSSIVLHSPIFSTTVTNVETDLPQKKEISSPNMGSAAENGSVPLNFSTSRVNPSPSEPLPPTDSGRSESCCESLDVGPAKDEAVTSPKKESPVVGPDNDLEVATTIEADSTVSAIESQRYDKLEIDLMALPPPMRSSPEREGEINFVAALEQELLTADNEDENAIKSGKDEDMNVKPEQKKAKVTAEEAESEIKPVVNKERNIDYQLYLERQDRDITLGGNRLNPEVQKPQQQQQLKAVMDGVQPRENPGISVSGNKLNPEVQKPQQQPQPKAAKDDVQPREKVAQSAALPLPLSLGSWPGEGLPPMGYLAPLQEVVSIDGNTASPTQIQSFSHPRPKRCATHCYIARNILYLQQIMKTNPFWPPSAGSAASLFGGKPVELLGNNVGRTINSVQEKCHGLSIFSDHSGKDKGAQATTNIPDAQSKQQKVLLQQALPPGASSNVLHGPAFIFPLNQQQAAAATSTASSIRPGSVKPPHTSGNVASTSSSTSASVSKSTTAPSAATAVTFNYPNVPVSETQQYLAILQNSPYPFPIPSVGAPPPTYRGAHAQAIPFFNGSFYSSQMIHPSQLQQQQQQQLPTQQQNTSSGSSSSQKHLHSQQQQRQQCSSGNNLHNFPAPPQKANQHMPNAEIGGEDCPSTADSRLARTSMGGVYSQNFAAVPMPIHPQNFALITPSPSLASSGGGNQGEKKLQQGLKSGLESIPPQTFAMSFGSMHGVDMSSMAQNHAVLKSLPETSRQSFQMMAAAAAAQVGQQKRNFRVSEENKIASSAGDSSNNVDDEKKSLTVKPVGQQQSIVFSRTDSPDSISAPPLRAPRSSSTPNALATANAPPNSQLQAQLQYQQHHQQMMLLHKHHLQQQQQLASAEATARNKNNTLSTSNGSVYSDHLASSGKFSNGNFPQNLVQNGSSSSSSPSQSQNSIKTTSQVPSATSSLKNLPQQQTRTQHNQTQISFGGAQKTATPPPKGQQSATSHRTPSPPTAVASPTTSSISKGANGSPRTTTTSASAGSKSSQPSTLSAQPPKNSNSVGSRNVSSVLSNSHVTFSNTSVKTQMQQQQQQQQQMLLSHAYMQAQTANQPFYLQRRRLEPPPQDSSATSTGMLSLSSAVAGSTASTSDAKAVTASMVSAAASNLKGGGGLSPQGILHSAVPPGFSYVHVVPSPGPLKLCEQKQPAGNHNSLTRK